MLSLWYLFSLVSNRNPRNCEEKEKLEYEIGQLEGKQNSLMVKYLTPDLREKLACVKTVGGFDIFDVIAPGLNNKDVEIGVQIPHKHCLSLFSKLYNPIIMEIHGSSNIHTSHPEADFGSPSLLNNIDPSGNFLLSTQIEIMRNLDDFDFAEWACETELLEIESHVKRGIEQFSKDLKGTFLPIDIIDEEIVCFLKNENIYIDMSDACPIGKSFYMNDEKNLIVWINYKDHLSLLTIGEGGDLKTPYQQAVRALNLLERRMEFAKYENFGYIGPDLRTLGTGFTIRGFLNLPNLVSQREGFQKMVASNGFELTRVSYPSSDDSNCKWNLENKKHLFVSEFQTISIFQRLICCLIKNEMKMNASNCIKKVTASSKPVCIFDTCNNTDPDTEESFTNDSIGESSKSMHSSNYTATTSGTKSFNDRSLTGKSTIFSDSSKKSISRVSNNNNSLSSKINIDSSKHSLSSEYTIGNDTRSDEDDEHSMESRSIKESSKNSLSTDFTGSTTSSKATCSTNEPTVASQSILITESEKPVSNENSINSKSKSFEDRSLTSKSTFITQSTKEVASNERSTSSRTKSFDDRSLTSKSNLDA